MRTFVAGMLTWLMLVTLAWGQALPAQTEVYVGGHLFRSRRRASEQLARLEKLPLFRVLVDGLTGSTKLDLRKDVLANLQGSFALGVVRLGAESPFYLVEQRIKARRQYDAAVGALRTVGQAVASFKKEKHRLPETLSELVPEYLEQLPQSPAGVAYRYLINPDGSWKVACVFQPGTPVARAGRPPVYQHSSVAPDHPSLTPGPYNLVVCLRLRNARDARSTLEKLLGQASGHELWRTGSGHDAGGLTLAIRAGWLVITDRRRLLAPVVASLTGKAPGISTNPRYRYQLRAARPHPDTFAFVDLTGIRRHWPGIAISDSMIKDTLDALRSVGMGYYVTPDRVMSEALLEVKPRPDSPLAPLFTSHGSSRFPVLSRVPWTVSNVVVADDKEVLKILDAATEVEPALNMMTGYAITSIESALNLSLHRDLLPFSSGELALSFERSDLFAQALRRGLEGGKRAHSRNFVYQMPFTVALGLQPGRARSRVLQRLRKLAGTDRVVYHHDGVLVTRSADGMLAYATTGDYLLVSGGGTVRLLEGMLDAATRHTASLAALHSYRDFQATIRGDLLLYSYSKVDWAYSIAKGVVLMLGGAEFRPQAVHLGRWRDAYTAISLNHQGIWAVNVLYATDQVPR